MELYEILIIALGLIVCIGLDRVYRLMSDIRDNGIMSTIEYTISDDHVQTIVDIVLQTLENRKKDADKTTKEELQSSDS